MKVNISPNYNMKHQTSFGLKIVKDTEYVNLVNYLKKNNIANESEVTNLFNKIEDLAFNEDNKHSTSIAFSPIQYIENKNSKYKSNLDANGQRLTKGVKYHLWDSNTKVSGPVKMRWVLPLTNTNVKNILSEIASDYAKYAYSK